MTYNHNNKTVQDVRSNRTSRKASPRFSENKKPQKNVSTNKKKRYLKRIKSRELFGGQVFLDCDCYHRNGLQHDCPRSLCGRESCQEMPLPKCDLGTYFIDKWTTYYNKLDRLMPSTFCGSEEEWLNEINKWEANKSQKNMIDKKKK
ncbi:uncharacterized protein LOC124952236 [Vespa velutina]|uniref:uncharacterized protein LOC124952236 n=1 Tax=Vespa velutina TaxID=202808 RepID=UPI001FB22211|nr:uncharacterized protein LOC124952236 [Vespa velutina]